MIENKFPMRPILRTPIIGPPSENKKVSFEQDNTATVNKGLIRSQIMRAGIYDKFMQQQAMFSQPATTTVSKRILENIQKERKIFEENEKKSFFELESESARQLMSHENPFQSNMSEQIESKTFSVENKITENENPPKEISPNVSLELSNSSRLSFPQLHEILIKKEMQSPIKDKAGSPDQKIKLSFKGKVKAFNAISSLKKSQPSPEKRKLFERLSENLSLLPKHEPLTESIEVEKHAQSAIIVRGGESDSLPQIHPNLRYSAETGSIIDEQKLLKSSLFDNNSEVMKILEQYRKSREAAEQSGLASSLEKAEDEFNRVMAELEGKEIPDYKKSIQEVNEEGLEATETKTAVSGVLYTVLQNIAINRVANLVQDAFNAIKREYIRKSERNQKFKQAFTILDEEKFRSRFCETAIVLFKEHYQNCVLYDFAIDFNRKMVTCNVFKALKEYAIKKAQQKQILKTMQYKVTLNAKKRILHHLFSYAVFSKEWVKNVKAEFSRLKLIKILEFWKKYTKKEKLNKKMNFYIEEKERQIKVKNFQIWKNDALAHILIAEKMSQDFLKKRLQTKSLKVWIEYTARKIHNKHSEIKAYLHLNDKLQGKFFKGLCYATFERGKRTIKLDDDQDHFQLKISIKDKVSKTTYLDKKVAILSNEKSVTIDMPKKY